jgi:hypothetical protein
MDLGKRNSVYPEKKERGLLMDPKNSIEKATFSLWLNGSTHPPPTSLFVFITNTLITAIPFFLSPPFFTLYVRWMGGGGGEPILEAAKKCDLLY